MARCATMREKCGTTAHGSRGSEVTSALLAKVNAFCAQAGVSGTRDRERERLIVANRTLSSSAECGFHCSHTLYCCNSLCRPCWKRACHVVGTNNSRSFVRCSCRVGRGKDVTGKKNGRIRGNGRIKTTCRRTNIYFPKLIFKEWTPWLTLAGSCATAETKET